MLKLGLLGFGVVGKGVYEIVESRFQDSIKVTSILVKDEAEKSLDITTIDPSDVLDNKDVDVVVEVMGGLSPAYEYIVRALKNKKSVVTSNKAVVAKYLEEFHALAQENNVSFKYEASVGGGIPWISSIEKVARIDDVSEIFGIFNGTSNFILDKMTKEEVDFAPTLKLAQELGYAERDPSADIDGIDVMRKILISSSLAYKTIVPEEEIKTFGIRNIEKIDIDYFRENNMVVKLIAKSKKVNDTYVAAVEPTAFSTSHMESVVPTNFNIGTIKGHTIGELKFYGQGAGLLPTGNAVVQDIVDIMEKEKAFVPDFSNKLSVDATLLSGSYYVRPNNDDFAVTYSNLIKETKEYNGIKIYITNEVDPHTMNEVANKYIDSNIFYAKLEK